MATSYSGEGGVKRDFFGGQMVSLYFRSRDLYDVLGKGRAWQFWAVNPEQRALLCAINGDDAFVLMIQMQADQSPEDIDMLDIVDLDDGIELRMWLAPSRADRLSERRRHIAGPTGCGLCGIDSITEAVRPAAFADAAVAPDLTIDSADRIGHDYSAASTTGAIRREWRACSSYAFCHSDGPFDGEICTAVTLYSGQLVAQSEYSVVMTLACVSG